RTGLTILTRAETEAIVGDNRIKAVRLADGRELPADLVVFAVGVKPNIDLARDAGLDVNRGITVDDFMLTSDPDIFAVGECAEHRGQTFGLAGPLWEQARICAEVLCGGAPARYVAAAPHTSLKVTGVDLFSAGVLEARDDGDEEITLRDAGSGQYKKLVLRNSRLVGAILCGEIADGPWFVELIESKREIAPLRDGLMFGRALAMAAWARPRCPLLPSPLQCAPHALIAASAVASSPPSLLPPPLWGRVGVGGRGIAARQCPSPRPPPPTPPHKGEGGAGE